MDGSLHSYLPPLDVSRVAGRITTFLARQHDHAHQRGQAAVARRYDVGLETIYFAAMLLIIVDGTGETRDRADVLAALDAVDEVVADLRRWIEGGPG